MGIWGIGSFDNDTALDWVFELEEYSDISFIEETVDAVFNGEYIDSDVGSEALIAIEVIARLNGNFGVKNPYAEDLDSWVKSHRVEVSNALMGKAKKALKLIISKKSELHKLWEETDDYESWKNEVKLLKGRL